MKSVSLGCSGLFITVGWSSAGLQATVMAWHGVHPGWTHRQRGLYWSARDSLWTQYISDMTQ
jgi:hypothetical protein